MSGKNWLYAVLIAAAVGGPYVATREEPTSSQWWHAMWSEDVDSSSPLAAIGSRADDIPSHRSAANQPWRAPLSSFTRPGDAPAVPIARTPQPPLPTLVESLRFDLSPEWVTYRWPQVWKQQQDSDLASLRVTLLSGTRVTDVAGSVTYSFDKSHQLQRIELDGTCGDPSELVSIVTQYYGLQPVPAVGGYQYLARGNRKTITSAMRIENSTVVRQSQPFERFRVALELNRPGSRRQISDRMREKLDLAEADAKMTDKEDALGYKDQKGRTSKDTSDANLLNPSDPRRPLDALLPNAG